MSEHGSNSSPETVWVELPRKTAEAMVENCEVNIGFSLNALQAGVSRDTAEKLVALMEHFKVMMQAGRKALK